MGVIIAIVIIVLWSLNLIFSLNFIEISVSNIWLYIAFFLQTYLYTGLFITAHDSMHGTVSTNKKLNTIIGSLATFLYAAMNYRVLKQKHKLHHQFPATANDPDYNTENQNFFVWWFKFMMQYLTVFQIILMAIAFNLLKIWFSDIQILLFWVAPAILSTFQLFYFGTYLPHKKPHSHTMTEHRARTQKNNHFWAMLTCYFFGYHLEHHLYPHVPWWKLYQTKNTQQKHD